MVCLKWKMFFEVWALAKSMKPWFFDAWSFWFNCGPVDGMIGFIL